MNKTRKIRQEEIELVAHLLSLRGHTLEQLPVSEEVFEYEGGVMGSINFHNHQPDEYLGDLVAVEYTDSDGTAVVITLTVTKSQQLLDLDFWKEDFSKLIDYPKPTNVSEKK